LVALNANGRRTTRLAEEAAMARASARTIGTTETGINGNFMHPATKMGFKVG